MRTLSRRFAVALLVGFSTNIAPYVAFGDEKPSVVPTDTTTDVVASAKTSELSDKEDKKDDDGLKYVRSRLDQFINLDCDGKPFNELLKELAALAKVDIVIDRVEGKCFNAPVTLHLKHCRTKVVLKQVLNQIDDQLSFAIRDGFVVVASQERLDAIHEARVYRNGILPSMTSGLPVGGAYAPEQPAENLRNLLSVIEPQTWEQQGGQGRVAYANGNLVVWQNPRVHEQIVELLEQLRAADQQDMRDYEKMVPPTGTPGPAASLPSLPLPAGPSSLEPTPR